MLIVDINAFRKGTVSALHFSSLNRAASKAACSSSVGKMSVFIGAKSSVLITNSSSVRLLSIDGLKNARKNVTALLISC